MNRVVDQTSAFGVAPSRWLGPALIAIATLVGLVWSWGTWPDVVVDFGRELYVPWRLASGDVLYRDIAYFNGPLSPYFNSVLFRLFGPSLLTLVIANIFVLVALLSVLYVIFVQIAGRASALLACLTLLALFAFGQMEITGNSNWICPYAHEMTHGLLLSVLSVYLLWVHASGKGLRWVAGSGFALGLVFLTKCEIFLAVALANVILFIMMFADRRSRWITARALSVWGLFMLAPVILAFGLLAAAMPARHALIGTLGSWIHLLNRELTGLIYYAVGMGTHDAASNIGRLLLWTFGYALALIPVLGAALACRRNVLLSRVVALGMFVAVALILALSRVHVPWRQMARPWPLAMLVLAVATAVSLHRYKAEPALRQKLVLRLAMSVLALGLLGKMILNARLMHYGFALAMPATLLVIAALWEWLPAATVRLGGQASVVRAAVMGAWLVTVTVHLHISAGYFAAKTFPVGSGADRFAADARGKLVAEALERIADRARPDQSMTALPEGVMLNYLTRVPAATRHFQFLPPEMKMFGEIRMLEALRAQPPEWIVLVNRDDSEYGFRFFGRDYGQKLAAWIMKHYRKDGLIGKPVFVDQSFGILIARRKQQ